MKSNCGLFLGSDTCTVCTEGQNDGLTRSLQALLVPFLPAVRDVKAGTEGHIALLIPIAFTANITLKLP